MSAQHGGGVPAPGYDDKNIQQEVDHVDDVTVASQRGDETPQGHKADHGRPMPNIHPHMTAEQRGIALKLAHDIDPGPSILSWRYMLFVFTAFIAILNSGDNDEYYQASHRAFQLTCSALTLRWNRHGLGQLDGAVPRLLWTQCRRSWHRSCVRTSFRTLSCAILTKSQGMYTVGQVCAFFANIYLPDKFGRRWAMFIPNLLQW